MIVITDCKSYGYSDWSGENNVQCFDSYNTSMQVYSDWSESNAFNRPWVWFTCNEPLFYWQTFVYPYSSVHPRVVPCLNDCPR